MFKDEIRKYWELHSAVWKLLWKPYLEFPESLAYDMDALANTANALYELYRKDCGDQFTCQTIMTVVREINRREKREYEERRYS